MIKNILVAFDGTKGAQAAFLFGMDMANTFKASLTVLSVVRVLEPPEDVETQDNLERGREHYEKFFTELRQKSQANGLSVKTEVALGHPAEQIVHWAEQNHADLIVMGHQSRNTFGQWLLGSVPDKVMHYAPCSVIIVKNDYTV